MMMCVLQNIAIFLYSLDADPDGIEVGLGVHHAGADVQHVVGLRFGMLRHPAWQ